MVRVTFGVKVPESGSATRAMGSEAINSLHLIVFDEQGYFTYKAPATLEGSGVPNDPTTRQFSVELPNSSAKRIIHFVANVSAQFDAINSGHEDGVMSSLYVTGDADAYWQRMEYNGGIANDASTADFDKNAIIPLVRNYAKIKVQAAQNSGFTLKGFKVFNTYSQGSIAAYDGRFANFVEMDSTARDSERRMFTPKTYDEMGDYGCNEMGELNTEGIGDYASTAAAYVRETPSDATPYIIIYGTYSGDGKDYYYKLAFDGKHIYRNFEYIFNITSVTKAGYDEAGAKNSKAEGAGISWDPDTMSLLSLSDGESQLYVSATTIVMVDNTRTYELKYKYVPDITTGTADNGEVNISWKRDEVISNLVYTATAIDSEGYTTITITPATTMPTFLKDTKITIDDGKNLARQVNVYLMPAYDMTVTAYDGNVGTSDNKVAASVGEKVWVDVAIPTDVQPALFPLEFVFETAAQSLYPDATVDGQSMPVRTGQSIIDNTKTSFGFVYTLTLEEYNLLKTTAGEGASTVTFTAKFLTNKAASTSQVYVYNEYFNTGSDDFENSKARENRTLSVSLSDEASYYGAGHEVTVTLDNLAATSSVPVDVNINSGLAETRAQISTTYSNGTHTFKLYTNDWNTARSITVSCGDVETDTAIVTYSNGSASETVNKLYIPAGSLSAANSSNKPSTTKEVTVKVGNTTANEKIKFDYSNNQNSGIALSIPNLADNGSTSVTLTYTSSSKTYTATTTLEKLMSTTSDAISFTNKK